MSCIDMCILRRQGISTISDTREIVNSYTFFPPKADNVRIRSADGIIYNQGIRVKMHVRSEIRPK